MARTLLLSVLIFASGAHAHDWTYRGTYDLPMDAALGSSDDVKRWQASFGTTFRAWMTVITLTAPSRVTARPAESVGGLSVVQYDFRYSDLAAGGGLLVLPPNIDATKPIVIAIHGHETNPWGEHAWSLLQPGGWPYEIAQAGFVVWVPVSMSHDERLAKPRGYLLSWAKMISDGLEATGNFASVPHRNYVVSGLSSGGQIAQVLMAYRNDIAVGVFAGSSIPLEFLRREYRVIGHPDCWDIPGVMSYPALQSVIAPRPVQFQIGRQDIFWPDGQKFPTYSWFRGTSRDVLSVELAGEILTLRNIWQSIGGTASFHVHEGGHVMDVSAALEFLATH